MRKIRNNLLICTLISFTFFCCTGIGNAYADSLKKIKVMLSWSPVSEHAFLYYGIQKGFFKDNGLDVEVLPSKGSAEVSKALEANKIDFGFISGDVLVTSRIKGVRIRALATTLHDSPVCVYSLKETNILAPEDLRGKRFGILPQSASYPQFKLMLKKQGIDLDAITQIPTAGSAQELISGNIQAAIHYTHLTPTYMMVNGYKLNEFLLKDYGVNIVSSSIATTDTMIENNRQIITAFTSSIIKSLDESLKNPDGALQALLSAEPSLKPEQTRASLLRANELILTNEAKKEGPGYVKADDWDRTQKTLLEAEIISQKIPVEYFFDDSFYEGYRKDHPYK